jgi:hypothetical protein
MTKKETESVIMNVSSNPVYSMAKTFGSITLNDKKYCYINSQDALIRQDLLKKYTLCVEQRKTWDEFIELVKNI